MIKLVNTSNMYISTMMATTMVPSCTVVTTHYNLLKCDVLNFFPRSWQYVYHMYVYHGLFVDTTIFRNLLNTSSKFTFKLTLFPKYTCSYTCQLYIIILSIQCTS